MIMARKTELYTTIFMYSYGKNDKLLFHFYKLFGPLLEKSETFPYEIEKGSIIYLAKKNQIQFFQRDIIRRFQG